MATTTHYHLLPEDNRPSEDESAVYNECLLGSLHDDPNPPKERFHISGHATIYNRLAVICLLIPAFVILIIPGTPQTFPVEILSMICVVRNALVLLFHFISPCFRIRIEFVSGSPTLPVRKNHPHWFTRRCVQITIDILIWISLFVCDCNRIQGKSCGSSHPWGGPWYVRNNRAFLPGMALSWLAR